MEIADAADRRLAKSIKGSEKMEENNKQLTKEIRRLMLELAALQEMLIEVDGMRRCRRCGRMEAPPWRGEGDQYCDACLPLRDVPIPVDHVVGTEFCGSTATELNRGHKKQGAE